MVVELVDVDLQRALVTSQSAQQQRTCFVQCLGGEPTQNAIRTVRGRRLQEVEHLLVVFLECSWRASVRGSQHRMTYGY